MATSKSAPATDPVCGASCSEIVASGDDVAAEIELRRSFFLSRLTGSVDARDLRDLTEMTTNDAAAIYDCACGVLVRDDPKRTPARFARDEYDVHTLRRLYELHVATFVAKTSIRDVTTERFERCDFAPQSFDGVFIWNCFEQLTNPHEVLEIVQRIARPAAPLVIYVPDADVYRDAQRAFAAGEPRSAVSPVVQQLAYNNLLGFPHHFGYGRRSLTSLLAACGFAIESIEAAPAIRPLREKLTGEAREEEARVEPAWLQVVGRKK